MKDPTIKSLKYHGDDVEVLLTAVAPGKMRINKKLMLKVLRSEIPSEFVYVQTNRVKKQDGVVISKDGVIELTQEYITENPGIREGFQSLILGVISDPKGKRGLPKKLQKVTA